MRKCERPLGKMRMLSLYELWINRLYVRSSCKLEREGKTNETERWVFEGKVTPNAILVERVNPPVEDQGKYAQRIYNNQTTKNQNDTAKKWPAPPVGVIKINADASLVDEGWIDMGVIARNHKGRVLFAATRRERAWWSPEIAEAKALILAINLEKRHGLQEIILESDCKQLVSRLNQSITHLSDLDSVLCDILSLCSVFMSLSWSHVRREGNSVAHHLAKLFPFGSQQVWENHCPMQVACHVSMDILSLH
ncbi:hypothetical protein POM88_011439 [Heracleum sosnowskyi]|uniref:RNase H type-1 domain-containing protein n=1 Tax=Heracleum sosnowskyi TaxID=360622 RepID=A0AAD8IWT8_9APIA|nr:hypothetical protein POM88_011439 [Heracleum sosnowskyi]